MSHLLRRSASMLSTLAVVLVIALAGPAQSADHGDDESTVGSADSSVLVDQSGVAIEMARADYFVSVREGYGLSASISGIQKIIDDYGVASEWGSPLTPSELGTLENRLAIQQELSDDVILGFQSLLGYAGFYFDHLNDGAPTILTTDPDATRGAVADVVPAGIVEGVIVASAAYSWNDLVEAAHTIAGATDPTVRDQVHRIAMRVKTNQLGLSILDAQQVDNVRSLVSGLISVPFTIVVEPLSESEACPSRAMCYSPFRAGVEVWGGGGGSTLGFGVLRFGDRQYVMAGHHSASTYTHYIFNIGSTSHSAYSNNGIDARAIYASDSQVSDDIYVTPTFFRDVTGTKYPSVGLLVCMSGMKNVSCGTVQDNWLLYSISGGASDLLGASANYYSQSGDSGAPVYQIAGSSTARAVGIHSAGAGDREFARVYDFNTYLTVTVATS